MVQQQQSQIRYTPSIIWDFIGTVWTRKITEIEKSHSVYHEMSAPRMGAKGGSPPVLEDALDSG